MFVNLAARDRFKRLSSLAVPGGWDREDEPAELPGLEHEQGRDDDGQAR